MPTPNTIRRLVFPILALFALFAAPALAGSIELQWDPVTDPDLEGYRVYYGTSPGSYDQNIEVGNVTSYNLQGLADCTTWYVAVKAYDTGGLESELYSNEVEGWPRPVVSSAVPAQGETGGQVSVTITGTNFMDGAIVDFLDAGIIVDAVTWNSCTEVVADITIASDAALGAKNIDVVNPDDVYGTGVALFTVVSGAQAPSVTSHPDDQSVARGRVAIFSVAADGTAPLSYQWKRDGSDIAGATEATYVTPPTVAGDHLSTYSCVVTNSAGSDESNPATLSVTDPGTRVTDGLLSLYNFAEGSGTTVGDVSGVGDPLDLTIEDDTWTTWTASGLSIDNGTRVTSSGAAAKIIDAVTVSNEITVEAWVSPANTTQSGPAPVVTISSSLSSRNVTLGQQAGTWDGALRTTSTDDNGRPTLTSAAGSAVARQSHVVYTRDNSGTVKIWVDGVEQGSGSVAGDLSGWNTLYRFGLANEFGASAPWLGEYQLVATYDRALTATEIDQNFLAGPDGDSPPPANVPPTAACTIDPTTGDAPLSVSFDATPSEDSDGTIVDYHWDFGDGTTGSGVTTTHVYTSAGSYDVVLTVTDDDDATDTDNGSVTAYEPVVPPSITSHPQDSTVDEGQTGTFTVTASGTAPLAYQWRKNGSDIAGATSATYTTPPTVMSDNGSTYLCVVSNSAGSDTSNPATLTVLDATAPTVVSTVPEDGATKVARSVQPQVTFSEAMNGSTITASTVQLLDPSGQPVAQAAGSPSLSGATATITPADPLAYETVFRIRVVGGAGGVEDVAGNPMDSTYTQNPGFTVEKEPNSPPGKVENLKRKNKKPKS